MPATTTAFWPCQQVGGRLTTSFPGGDQRPVTLTVPPRRASRNLRERAVGHAPPRRTGHQALPRRHHWAEDSQVSAGLVRKWLAHHATYPLIPSFFINIFFAQVHAGRLPLARNEHCAERRRLARKRRSAHHDRLHVGIRCARQKAAPIINSCIPLSNLQTSGGTPALSVSVWAGTWSARTFRLRQVGDGSSVFHSFSASDPRADVPLFRCTFFLGALTSPSPLLHIFLMV